MVEIIHSKESTMLHAVDDSKVIGYLKYSTIDNRKKNRQIDYLYVDIPYRHQGVASKLLSYIIKYSKDMNWISLWTGMETEVDESYVIYEKFGFKQLIVLEDCYEDGIPSRLFVKNMRKEKQ
jgi:ribosomal protein S18 acetylase RimI-like enzyme